MAVILGSADELLLDLVLLWSITTHPKLADAHYRHDASARLQDTQYDKSELELQILLATADNKEPDRPASIEKGKVTCYEFPLVILTSNGERDFPPAFLRRCPRIRMPDPTDIRVLTKIVEAHFDRGDRASTGDSWSEVEPNVASLIQNFADDLKRKPSSLATDQLLNLIYMVRQSQLTASDLSEEKKVELQKLKDILLRRLTNEGNRT